MKKSVFPASRLHRRFLIAEGRLAARQAHYAQEQRWMGEDFWRRRVTRAG